MHSVAISVLDTNGNKASRDVRLNNARQAQPVTILEVDEGGLTHMQVNLTALSTTAGGTAALSQFDTIQFKDVSNTGLSLVLDDINFFQQTPAH